MTQPNDASKKSPRTFQCRDQLWETFEQMARELECSIDYLINEAMKQYARQRSYGAGGAPQPSRTPFPGARDSMQEMQRAPAPPTAGSQRGMGGGMGGPPPPPISRAGGGPPPIPRQPASMPPQQAMPTPPPMGPGGGMGMGGMGGGMGGMGGHPMPPPPPPMGMGGGMGMGGPPPPPPQMGYMQQQPQQGYLGGLTAIYQGERTSVNKEKFIIGRGRQTSDLTIKDPNVSRQHAMVEFQNGVYYMVDLGSTNGVEYHGQRVTRKAIAEGDVFRICDHEVVFTYR
jgi:hypothetical protein